MLVPGIGSGSCECRKPLARIWRTKSACFFSCCEGSPCSWGYQPDPLAVLPTHETHGFGDVAIVADDHSAVVRVEPGVVQQMHSEIDVGSLLLGLDYLCRVPSPQRLCKWRSDSVSEKMPNNAPPLPVGTVGEHGDTSLGAVASTGRTARRTLLR